MKLSTSLGACPLGRAISAGSAVLGLGMGACAFLPHQTPPEKIDFVEDIQPIFKAHCLRCHSGAQAPAELSLENFPNLMKGGVSGKTVVPGNGAGSLLIQRVLGQGGKQKMPIGFAPLPDQDVAKLRSWIDQGANGPEKGHEKHWAYIAPVRPAVPMIPAANGRSWNLSPLPPSPRSGEGEWVRNPIDAFILQKLLQEGLKPSPEADKNTLIRRVTLDLAGLPPTPAEIEAFVADKSPNAYERVVDRLFANPHYGERMALPWLDASRYADSNGFQMDGDNNQYVWRDWVVRAMNANMPFDRFTELQLAGDLLPGATLDTQAGRDQIVATAFNRNHMLNGEGGAIPEEQRNVALFDRVDTTSTAFLGLTMGCARCHDHKYDPFTQHDYYSMLAYFNNVPELGIAEGNGRGAIAEPWIYAGTDLQMKMLRMTEGQKNEAYPAVKAYEDSAQSKTDQAAWEHGLDLSKLSKEMKAALAVPAEKRNGQQGGLLRSRFLEEGLTGKAKADRERWKALGARLAKLENRLPRVMVMSDHQPRPAHIFSRGNYEAPLAKVDPCSPAELPPMPKDAPRNRIGLAEWMVSAQNPLTARVQVNCYWQMFFGKGLVRTPENFGIQGERPTHPELLDWLAVEFRESGWNVKRLQKMIVMSATYRQSSKVSKELRERDPDNRLWARGARFRLPAMLIRDVALASSGLLNPLMGGKPVYPYQPKGIWDSLNITDERDFSYPQSKGPDLYRRSIYTFWRRTASPGDMFDSSSRQVCTVKFSQTSTPLHALTMLNDETWVEAGRALAQLVMSEKRSSGDRLSEAFFRVCARYPDHNELAILERSFDRALGAFRAKPEDAIAYLNIGESPRDRSLDPAELAAFATVCSAIYNLDEAMTRE